MEFLARIVMLVALATLSACGVSGHPVHGFEAVSLDGRALIRPELPGNRAADLRADLARAEEAFRADPSEANTIWLGRRQAYLGEFAMAIRTYSDGLARFPKSYRMLRHRGHRYITTRQFTLARRDLMRAASLAEGHADEVEPDGAPNAAGVPRSTDRSNIYYHLGLVNYLMGRWDEADRWFAARDGLDSLNDDMLVSTTHWRVLALTRVGRREDASELLDRVIPIMDVIENRSYQRLCLFYKGELSEVELLGTGPLDPAVGYGVAAWSMSHGRDATQLFERVLAETGWPSFGHIAAEAELARVRSR